MEDDLIELARICARHAQATHAPGAAAALRRMAKEYQRRAALLHGNNKLLQGSRVRPRRRAAINDCSGIGQGHPHPAAPSPARRSLHIQ